ncbi:hypothetical protein M3Y98_00816700 [Aphelenchoides besseyi]|nr:hypothetical protein M3Y98_00816700 [Aphelenchoides besseyi]KAI6212178.1 hypothetical protein M3Y96_00512900 [Aphelenchoides besseyi]
MLSSPNNSTGSESSLSPLAAETSGYSPNGVCTICRIEPFTVYYLKTPVCTGCRAFFRRSIKQRKQYRCLQGRLCGQNSLVPTRRACKYCRFQKCIELGMLESKLLLHSEERRQISTFSKKIPAVTSTIFMSEALGDCLRWFTRIRRNTRFEFFANYEQQFPELCGGNTDGSFLAEARESPSGGHDLKLTHIEFLIFNRIARNENSLFQQMDQHEWDTYSNDFCSQYFALFNRVTACIRFNGHETKRSFNIDGTYFSLNEDVTENHFSFITQAIESSARSSIYPIIHEFMRGCSVHLVHQVAKRVAEAHLDEVEASALLLLLFTSPESLSSVSEKTAEKLRCCRQNTIRELSEYIQSTGRDVSNRLATVIFLTSEFYNLRKLANYIVILLYHATQGGILPDDFREWVGKSKCRSPRL